MKRTGDFYFLRSTLLPVHIVDAKVAEIEPLIDQLLTQQYFIEAIYLASPNLYEEVVKCQRGDIKDAARKNKAYLGIYKYLLRMCSRPIPFGLFAGCARGEIATATQIIYGDLSKHFKKQRLNAETLEIVVSSVVSDAQLKEKITYCTNNSLYQFADQFRYTQFRIKGSRRIYELQSVKSNIYIKKIIEAASQGISFPELVQLLKADNIDEQEAAGFLHDLINAQLLVPAIEPSPIDDDQLLSFMQNLKTIDGTQEAVRQLKSIHEDLLRQEYGMAMHQAIIEKLKPFQISLSSTPVQSDMHLHMHKNKLSKRIADEIIEAVSELQVLSYDNDDADLAEFKKAFYAKFEQREIPLSLALDNEFGIGYGEKKGIMADHHPLFAGLNLNSNGRKSGPMADQLTNLQVKKLKESVRGGKRLVEIEPGEIAGFKNTCRYLLPGSLYVMGSLLASSEADLDAGNYLFELTSFFGPSAANLMARFANGSAELQADLRAALETEESLYPDFVFAEIVHVPNSKAGNIISRPPLRRYEIPYITNGSSANTTKITVDDLLVSIRDNEIVLRSKTLNKRVIPRLTTAHNFHFDSLPLYRFLCDLQSQKTAMPFNWSWGLLENEDFLPRVMYKKIVLQKARWLIRLSDYPEIKTDDENKLGRLIRDMRDNLGLPVKVCISYGDNQLAINLDNPLCHQLLRKELMSKRKIGLTEFLHDNDNCFITGEEGKYCNEIIIPVISEKVSDSYRLASFSPGNEQVSRAFAPGGQWLYYKIYSGTATADEILTGPIANIVQMLEREKIIAKWFFIRYLDPEPHIRLRFLLNNAGSAGYVITKLYDAFSALVEKGIIHKIQLDTYTREVERYGSDLIELSESVFHIDSQFVLGVLPVIRNSVTDLRWLTGIKGIDDYLQAWNFTLPEKQQFVKDVQDAFFEEFHVDKGLMKQVNAQYRKNFQKISRLVLETEVDPKEKQVLEKINSFSDLLKEVFDPLMYQGLDNTRRDDLLQSYIHMYINRLFISQQRKYELMLYSFLFKYYEGQIARKKHFSNKLFQK
jgi:lantibiotic biosynthesis protein